MVEQSYIYAVLKAFWAAYLNFYRNSLVYRMVAAVTGAIMQAWGGSFIRRLFMKNLGLERAFENGLLGRGTAKVFGGLNRLGEKGGAIAADSKICKLLAGVLDGLLYFSLRNYGVFLIGLGVPAAVVYYSDGGVGFYMGILAFALGCACLLVKASVAGLCKGSGVLNWVLGFFGLDSLKEKDMAGNHYLFFGAFGLLLGCSSAFLSPLYFLLGVAGVIGGLLVLYKIEIGVFAAAFLIPLVPTKLILGLFSLVLLSFLIKLFFTGEIKLKCKLIDLFVLFFACLLVFSVGISYHSQNSAVVASTYILFIGFYFVVRNVVNTKGKLKAVFSLVALSGGLVALYGIYQKITNNFVITEAWLDTDMFDESLSRIYSTLDNPNVLGEYLLFLMPVAFAMLYYCKKYSYKSIAACVLGVAGLCMVYTQSRGAWLGLLFAFALFILVNDRKLIWLGFLGLLLAPLILPQSIVDRFASIGNLGDSSTSYRVNIWMASLLMIKVFWPIGIGLGTETFMLIYHKYAYNAVYAPHSHNLYLQILIDLGITGLLLFIFYMASFYKTLLLKIGDKSGAFLKSAAAALAAGMSGFLLQGFTDNVWYNYRIVAFFWMVMGLAAALGNMGADTEDPAILKEGQKEEAA